MLLSTLTCLSCSALLRGWNLALPLPQRKSDARWIRKVKCRCRQRRKVKKKGEEEEGEHGEQKQQK